MIPILAETDPTAQSLKDWLIVAGFLISLAVGIKVLFFEKKMPQPMVVKGAPDHVTTAAHDKDMADIKSELLRHAARRAEIYQQNTAMVAQVAALEEKADLTHAQVNRLDGKIDRILERLPRRSHDS